MTTQVSSAATAFDQDLLKFLSEHYDGGVIHVKGYAEPEKKPTSALANISSPVQAAGSDADGMKHFHCVSGDFELIGDLSTWISHVTYELNYRIPLYGSILLVTVSGSLLDGAEGKFNVFGVVSGTVRVFQQGRDVLCTIDATEFGRPYLVTFKILSL